MYYFEQFFLKKHKYFEYFLYFYSNFIQSPIVYNFIYDSEKKENTTIMLERNLYIKRCHKCESIYFKQK